MAGAGDVPLAGPRVLAVGAALQQQLPGALAVDPHVHRPVVVAVPVHLRPAGSAAAEEELRGPIEAKVEVGRGLWPGTCLGLETPVLSPAAVSTSRRSSGAAAIEGRRAAVGVEVGELSGIGTWDLGGSFSGLDCA